jgi:hypothetical protein
VQPGLDGAVGRGAGGGHQGEAGRHEHDRRQGRPAPQRLAGQLDGCREVERDLPVECRGGLAAGGEVPLGRS